MKLLNTLKKSRIWENNIRFILNDLRMIRYKNEYDKWKQTKLVRLSRAVCVATNGGFCDRLKSGISVYFFCKKYNVPFKFHFTIPFDLRLFLEPNEYDWTIDESEIKPSGVSYEDIDLVITGGENPHLQLDGYTTYLFVDKFMDEIFSQAKVEHLYLRCNKSIGYLHRNFSFSKSFHELFRPTKLVQERLDYYRNISGGG